MDPGFIEAVENSMGSVCRFRHVVVRDKAGRPLAAACLSSYTVDGASLAEGSAKVILSAIGRVWPWLTRNTMVMCGLPISSGDSHLRFAPHADRTSVLAILDRLICEFAREERARFIIFKEFNADGARDLEGLESLGYRQADSYPMNYAVSDYRDFDDYLSRIRSKKRRMLRGSIRKFAKGNFRVVTLTGREGAADHYTDRRPSLVRSRRSAARRCSSSICRPSSCESWPAGCPTIRRSRTFIAATKSSPTPPRSSAKRRFTAWCSASITN